MKKFLVTFGLCLLGVAVFAATAIVQCKSCETTEDYIKYGAAKIVAQQGGTAQVVSNVLTNIIFGNYLVDEGIVKDENGVTQAIVEFETNTIYVAGLPVIEQNAVMVRGTNETGGEATGLVRYTQALLTNLAQIWDDKEAAYEAVRNAGGNAENPPATPTPTATQLQNILNNLYTGTVNYSSTLNALNNLQDLSWLTDLQRDIRCHPECR